MAKVTGRKPVPTNTEVTPTLTRGEAEGLRNVLWGDDDRCDLERYDLAADIDY